MIDNKVGVTILFTNGSKTFMNDNSNRFKAEAFHHLCFKLEKLQYSIFKNGITNGCSMVLNQHVKNATRVLMGYDK